MFEEVCKQQIQKTSILTDIRVVQAKNDDSRVMLVVKMEMVWV